jgi:MFS transporter, CP family, cyanate transporter
MSRSSLAPFVILGGGIVGALHTGKVPAALPMVQAELGMSLVMAGTLISILQMSTACIGLFGGTIVDRFGAARCMVMGLLLLGLGSVWGGLSGSASVLLVSRLLESIGLVFTVLPGPSLLRQTIAPKRLMTWLGLWGAYMPLGMGLGLLIVPLAPGWRIAWWLIALLSFVWAAGLAWVLGTRALASVSMLQPVSMLANAKRTLSRSGPWLLSFGFACYAAQFMGVFGFLPTVYQEAGVAPSLAGVLTSVGVLANAWGNVQGGKRAQRGHPIDRTIRQAALVMMATAWLIFAAPLKGGVMALGLAEPSAIVLDFWLRFSAVLLFSFVAGWIPASFFNLSNRFAPGGDGVATTVGFMQQGGAVGQLFAPLLIAWVVTQTGTWGHTWWVTGSLALMLVASSYGLARELKRRKAFGK